MANMMAGVSSPNGVELRELPVPAPADEQVLVKVAAAGMNRADLAAARGAYGANAVGNAIGMEWAGEIVEVGKAVKGFRAGDTVLCSGSGGYAQYAVADHGRTLPFDRRKMSFEQAAILPLVLMTAHDAVVTNGRFASGESILVQGASSAVGIASLQIARLKGGRVIAGTSSNDWRRQQLAQYGASLALNPRADGWVDEVLGATGGRGVDLVIDMVSGPMMNLNMKATAVLGRIVNVGRLGGAKAEFDFDMHAAKRLDYIGVTFRTRNVDEVRKIVTRMRDDIWDQVVAGDISLPIDRSFPLAEARQAHAHMASNAHFGKIVLIP